MTEHAPRRGNILELPEAPARRLRRRVLLAAAGVLGALLVAMLVLIYSPLLAIKTIEVEGNRLAKTGALESALEPLLGVPLPQIGPSRVLDLLAGQPAVDDVVVQADAPSTLKVRVVEHHPVAVLKDGSAYRLVGGDGRILATVKGRDSEKLPLVDGATSAGGTEVFAAVTAVLAQLPDSVLARMDHARARTIDSVELTMRNGKKVLWGSAERGAEKARVLAALLKVEDDPADPVKVYDVSSPERPVTR